MAWVATLGVNDREEVDQLSYLANEWASEAAPVADVYERAILNKLATRANDDGCGAWPSVPSMARAALCDTETARRKLRAMQKRGLIGLGDQRLVSHYRADRRPRVYDLLIPADWYSDQQLTKVNTQRAEEGLPPLTAHNRPPLETAPTRRQRADTGKPNPNRRPQTAPSTAPLIEGPLSPVDNSHAPSHRGGDAPSVRGANPSIEENPSNQPAAAATTDAPETTRGDESNGWMDGDSTSHNSDTTATDEHTAPHPLEWGDSSEEAKNASQRATQPPATPALALLTEIEQRHGAHLHAHRTTHIHAIDTALQVLPRREVLHLLGDGLDQATNSAGVLVARIRKLGERVHARQAELASAAVRRRTATQHQHQPHQPQSARASHHHQRAKKAEIDSILHRRRHDTSSETPNRYAA